jgi:hypothetical protein
VPFTLYPWCPFLTDFRFGRIRRIPTGGYVPTMEAASRSVDETATEDSVGCKSRQRVASEEARLASETVFTVKGAPLESVKVFKYLGRPLSSTDDEWPAIYRNLTRARKRWAQVSRVLVREGADPKTAAMFYKAVVQSVLLYGCETWDTSPTVLALSGFQQSGAAAFGSQPSVLSQREPVDLPTFGGSFGGDRHVRNRALLAGPTGDIGGKYRHATYPGIV